MMPDVHDGERMDIDKHIWSMKNKGIKNKRGEVMQKQDEKPRSLTDLEEWAKQDLETFSHPSRQGFLMGLRAVAKLLDEEIKEVEDGGHSDCGCMLMAKRILGDYNQLKRD